MKEKRYNYIALGLLLALTILIRLPTLVEPWGGDQAGYGYVAKGMLEGKVPYKDMYALTGYGIFFAYAFFFKLFGVTMVSAHIGHLLISLITVILVFFLTQRLYGQKAAVIASFCYTIFSNGLAFSGFGYENRSAWGTYWYLSQREVFIALLIMSAILLTIIAEERNKTKLYFLIGILIGLAVVFKITAILMLGLLIIFILFHEYFKNRHFTFFLALRKTIYLILGFSLAQLPFLYYFWANNALADMYEVLFKHLPFLSKMVRVTRIESLLSGHYSILSENLILWLISGISFLHILFYKRNRNNMLILLWVLGSMMMIWMQGRFFGYYFILLIPPLAVLTGYGLPKLLAKGSGLKAFLTNNLRDIRKTFMLTTIIMILIGFGISNYDYYRWHAMYFFGKISKEEYYSVFNEFPTHPYSFRSDYQIVQYLEENRRSGDKLGVIFSAGDTIIHFLTGMEPATRFIQSWYLFSWDERLAKDEIAINLRKEFVEQLMDTAPQFILCVHIPLKELVELPELREDPSVKKLNEFIHTHYRLKNFPDNRFLFEKI